MYNNLQEKTNKTIDKSVDDTRMAGQNVQDEVWTTPRDTAKKAGVEAPAVSDNAKIEARNIVADPRIAEQRAGTPMKKAEI